MSPPHTINRRTFIIHGLSHMLNADDIVNRARAIRLQPIVRHATPPVYFEAGPAAKHDEELRALNSRRRLRASASSPAPIEYTGIFRYCSTPPRVDMMGA